MAEAEEPELLLLIPTRTLGICGSNFLSFLNH